MNKIKLLVGAVSALVIVATPITVSVHRNAAQAESAGQTAVLKPDVNETAKPVDVAPVQVNENTSDTTTPPATVKPEPKPACNQRVDVYCYGVHGTDNYGTPIPEVQVVQPAQPWVRSDGYFNYCYLMDDGSWTTVTGQLQLGKGIYYYAGAIDEATEAPAYAVESQQWCAANVPAEAL